jgi:uncharacterized protein
MSHLTSNIQPLTSGSGILMKLDLNELVGNAGKTYHYDIREDCASSEYEELHCAQPIVGSADFTNTGNLILVRGKMKTVLDVECSRCLGSSRIPVDVIIEEQFPIQSLEDVLAGHEEPILEDENEPLFVDNIFDLSEYIRQTVLVEVPIKPLCSDVCKGLCPHCGRNLNEGPCECPVTVETHPFSALQQLLRKEKDGGSDETA